MVVTLCKHCGAFVTSHARLFCGVVLGSLGEKEPVVVGPLWEAALLLVDLNHVRSSMCLLCMYIYTYGIWIKNVHVFLQSKLSISTH